MKLTHPFESLQSKTGHSSDLNKVHLTHEEQTLIIMLLRDMAVHVYIH